MGETNFLFRLLCTFILFAIFKIFNITSPAVLVGSLFLLDGLDCDYAKGGCFTLNFLMGKKTRVNGDEYHIYDKVTDVLTYMWFLGMFGKIFDEYTLKLLWGFTLYRFAGVCLYTTTKNREMLVYFPDFVNSTMIVYLLKYYTFPNISSTEYNICIMMGMMFKLWFETVKHRDQDTIGSLLGAN